MFSDSSEVLKFIKDTDVKFLDIRFTDLPGVQQHFNIPASTVDEDFFTVGQLFDGSSIRGFQSIHESDLQLIPDVSTAYVDPFRTERTLVMVFDIYNPRNGEIYARDPRQVAKKAEKFLASTGILGRLERSRVEHRARRRGRQPRQQDPVQGRLLPREPGRPAR
jgi:glutamine synthetase